MKDSVATADTTSNSRVKRFNQPAPDGAERISKNGYTYVKVVGRWRLKHHLIAEEFLGRLINPDEERVIFKDGDRTHLNPNNIKVVKKGSSSPERALAALVARRDELNARIQELEAQISSKQHR